MKAFFLLAIFCAAFNSFAADSKDQQWKSTTLSEKTIQNIQQSKYRYKQCVTKEMQSKTYIKMDTRAATDKILKKCEPELAHVRTVFKEEGVPEQIADRYMKMTRTKTARKVLEEMMFADAARQMGK